VQGQSIDGEQLDKDRRSQRCCVERVQASIQCSLESLLILTTWADSVSTRLTSASFPRLRWRCGSASA